MEERVQAHFKVEKNFVHDLIDQFERKLPFASWLKVRECVCE